MVTNFLQGIGTFGVLQAGPNPRGAVLFVNSVIGADGRGRVTFPGAGASQTGGSLQGPQTDPTKPLATLAYALTLCVGGRGDVIVLQQGHIESLAATITVSVAGVTIISLGAHGQRASFTMNGNTLLVTAAGCIINNLAFVAGTTANSSGVIQLNANGCQMLNCKITGSNVATVGIAIGASNCLVDSTEIDGSVTGFDQGISIGVFSNPTINNCNIHGIFATAPLNFTGIVSDMVVTNNIFRQTHASVGAVIAGILNSTSGMVTNNRYQSLVAATAAAYLAGANVTTNVLVIYLQNYGFTGKAGPSSGILIPTVGTIP